MSINEITTAIKNINLDYIIHLDHECEEEDCPCGNDNAVECEEEDCEACHRGKFCDCKDKCCPHCNNKEEEQCERCGEYHCEDDEEHEERVLWVSNVDGKNICRRCVREEDEEEDKKVAKCEVCDTNDQDGLGPLCSECYAEKEKRMMKYK